MNVINRISTDHLKQLYLPFLALAKFKKYRIPKFLCVDKVPFALHIGCSNQVNVRYVGLYQVVNFLNCAGFKTTNIFRHTC